MEQTTCITYILQERPAPLIAFICAVTGNDYEKLCENEKKKLYSLCLLIEQVYFVRNNNFIGCFSFSQSLVKWSLTGSKTAHSLDGSTTASGSITSLKKVLKDSSSTPNACFCENDVDVFFDNTQKIGKTHRVKAGGVTPTNVATNVVFLQSDPATSVQCEDNLKPGNWNQDGTGNTCERIREYDDKLKREVFRPYRCEYIENVLTEVKSELFFDENSKVHTDHITYSTNIADSLPDKRVCVKCCTVYPKSSSKCPNDACNHDPVTLQSREQLYDDVPSNIPHKPASARMGEVIGVNPNSRETVKEVLNNISKQCEVGTKRSWIRVGCDGVPYNIADSLLQDLVRCNVCKEEIDMRKQTFDAHVNESHRKRSTVAVTHTPVFNNILLVPGAGHVEINLIRAIFSFCKHIFLEEVAGMLGFKSRNAREFIVNGGSHHISWQICQIILAAFAAELCVVYIIYCKDHHVDPSAAGLLQWRNDVVVNPTYQVIFDITFTYLLGIKCFRSGIRRNNSEHMLAGRQSVAPIMFIKRHFIYQNLLRKDMAIRVNAPSAVKDYIRNHESFSVSGDSCKGEGGDYVTEAENRNLKSHMPPGVPTLQSWTTSSRCDHVLKDNRNAVFKRAGIADPCLQDSSLQNVEQEVQRLRGHIRKSGMIMDIENKALVSLTGNALHPDLVNFTFNAVDNYQAYLQNPNAQEMTPVFVTPSDEQDYLNANNWTIDKIKVETFSLLDTFPDRHLADTYRNRHSSNIARSKKEVHVNFYEEVLQALSTLSAITLDDTEE